jgi:hypothetical protein
MNRRQQLADVYRQVADIVGTDLGGPAISLLDAIAWLVDENDRLYGEVDELRGGDR